VAHFRRTSRDSDMESPHSQNVPPLLYPQNSSQSLFYVSNVCIHWCRFLITDLPVRAQNPNAQASVSLRLVANIANIFLSRASQSKNEDFLPWDADDIVNICINLIDQVSPRPPSLAIPLPQLSPPLCREFFDIGD